MSRPKGKRQVTREVRGTWRTTEYDKNKGGKQSQRHRISLRYLAMLVPAIATLIWDGVRASLTPRYTTTSARSREVADEALALFRYYRNRATHKRQRITQSVLLPLILMAIALRSFSDKLVKRLRAVTIIIARAWSWFSGGVRILLREYFILLSESDAKIEAISKRVDIALGEPRLSAEGLERRLGVQLRGSTAWIRKRREFLGLLKASERWGFVVMKPDVFRRLPEQTILYILDQFHQRLTPVKQIRLLEKTMAEVNRNAEWCQSEFSRTRKDWEIYAPQAALDPDVWREQALEWMVQYIGRHNLAWNTWFVLPLDQIPQSVIDTLVEVVGNPRELFLNRLEFEEMLYKIFNPLCDSDESDLTAFGEFQKRVFDGELVWDALLPELTSIEPWGIQTSSGAYITTLRLFSLGNDRVTYVPDPKKKEETRIEIFIRDMEWLKEQLTQVMLMDSRRDQQIWLETSLVGIPDSAAYLRALKRHLRTIDAWTEEERAALPDPERQYAEVIRVVYDTIDKKPTTPAYQQSYGIMLKAGDPDSLKALQDRVTQVLGFRDVLYEPSVYEYKHEDGLKRMLPVIWPHEVREHYQIPRESMPMTISNLITLFKTPQIEIPPMGGIVGMFADGKPLVFGPGNFGILGTTEVGKSIGLQEILEMTAPLAIAETEAFVVDIIGRKPDSELGSWHRTIVVQLGGEEIFPSLFTSPEALREYLDSRLDTLAFLYNPDTDLPNAVEYDMQFLKFVFARMTMKREEEPSEAPQPVLPGLESMGLSGYADGRPPRKKIRRRFFELDELEAWLQDPKDPRPMFLINQIMGQARKADMSFLYSLKSMESAMLVNPGVWSMLKNLTDKGWILFWTPDAKPVPETITYPRTTPQEARRADLIVDYIEDIRRLGGMMSVEETYGRFVYGTGDFVAPARFIVPPFLLPPMKRKQEKGWGG